MSIRETITDQLLNQCIDVVGDKKYLTKICGKIIDPLLDYFKAKIRFFFFIIICLLILVLVINLLMVGYFINLRQLIKVIKTEGLKMVQ